jgi:protein-tyrosine phosphatase
MNWITEHIAIGDRLDAHNAELRESEGFRCVISLDGSMSEDQALALGYDDCIAATLKDGAGNNIVQFKKLLRQLIEMADTCPPVLVHCHAGRSRSVTLVAAYLALCRGMTTTEAYRLIGQKRDICVTPGLESLVDACRADAR